MQQFIACKSKRGCDWSEFWDWEARSRFGVAETGGNVMLLNLPEPTEPLALVWMAGLKQFGTEHALSLLIRQKRS